MLPKAPLAAFAFRVCAIAIAVCGVWPLAACGEDGSAPYAGWTTLTDSEGVYKLRYLAPPWERVPLEAGDATIALAVPPAFGSADAGAPNKYSLKAQLVSGLALPVIRAQVAGVIGGRVLLEPAPYSTLSADEGFTAVVADDVRLRYQRFVALAAPGGRVLLVRLEMNEDPRRDLEVDAMLRAIDVRPFAE